MMTRKERFQAARVLATLAAVVMLGGCATKGDLRSLRTEVAAELRALAAQQDTLIAELRFQSLSTQDTLRTQSDQIFDFRGEISRQLSTIVQGLSTLQALAGENQRGISSVRDQLANARRQPTSTQQLPLDSAGSMGPGSEALVGTGGNADQLWGVAREQHQRGSYSTAQRAYEQFVEEYPSHALAADAHFYLADILTQQGRPDDALEAFKEIQTLYPTAARVPDALYRIAILQDEMGDRDDARATLERIINTYPDASIAMLARDLLDEIG